MSDDDEGRERKERVIHTRVPESLDEEIRERAQSLGISVSNLVRNVLRNAFGLVEDVIADGASVARSARGEGPLEEGEERPIRPGRVLGWPPLVPEMQALCSRCNAILPRNREAWLAVTERPGEAPVFHCADCVENDK